MAAGSRLKPSPMPWGQRGASGNVSWSNRRPLSPHQPPNPLASTWNVVHSKGFQVTSPYQQQPLAGSYGAGSIGGWHPYGQQQQPPPDVAARWAKAAGAAEPGGTARRPLRHGAPRSRPRERHPDLDFAFNGGSRRDFSIDGLKQAVSDQRPPKMGKGVPNAPMAFTDLDRAVLFYLKSDERTVAFEEHRAGKGHDESGNKAVKSKTPSGTKLSLPAGRSAQGGDPRQSTRGEQAQRDGQELLWQPHHE